MIFLKEALEFVKLKTSDSFDVFFKFQENKSISEESIENEVIKKILGE